MEKPFNNARLVLDEPRLIYYAGQTINGYIECELRQPQSLRAINVTFLGEAITEWSEIEKSEYNGRKIEEELTYSGREEYFNVTQSLPTNTQPHPGQHKFPFQFLIPGNVPSTYYEDRGHISYKVIAQIEYFQSHITTDVLEKDFEVVAPLDLNTEEGRSPAEILFEEYYSSCCSSKLLTIKITLPQTGYCPGQAIPINIVAQNETGAEVKGIIFQLVKRKGFRTSDPESEFEEADEVLETIKTGPILSHTDRELKYELVVPDMIAPNLDNCDIIDMGFGLKAKVKLAGCNSDIEDETEIILGLVPIPNTLGSENYVHPMKDSLPNGPVPIQTESNMIPVNQSNTMSPFPNPAMGYPSPQQFSYTPSHYPNQYPNTTPSNPNSMSPYPNEPQYYPTQTPNSNQPFYPSTPASNPGYPINSEEIPLTSMPVAPLGFVMPGEHLPQISPYPGGTAYPGNQQTNQFTPLMQNYPHNASAPPPST